MYERRIHLRFGDRSVRRHGVLCNHFGPTRITDDMAEVTCRACLLVMDDEQSREMLAGWMRRQGSDQDDEK